MRRSAERNRLDDGNEARAHEIDGERADEGPVLVARARDAVAVVVEARTVGAVHGGDDAIVGMRAVFRLQEEAVGAIADQIGDPIWREGRQLGRDDHAVRCAERLRARMREAVMRHHHRLAQSIVLARWRPTDDRGQ